MFWKFRLSSFYYNLLLYGTTTSHLHIDHYGGVFYFNFLLEQRIEKPETRFKKQLTNRIRNS